MVVHLLYISYHGYAVCPGKRLLNICCFFQIHLPSVLWRCWLGSRKGIRPVKNWVVGCWHGCMSGLWSKVQICISPSWCHCHSLPLAPVNPDWFYQNGSAFLVPAYPGCPGKQLLNECSSEFIKNWHCLFKNRQHPENLQLTYLQATSYY